MEIGLKRYSKPICMITKTENHKENNNQSLGNSFPQKQNEVKSSSLQIVDNSPVAIAQKKLQESAVMGMN